MKIIPYLLIPLFLTACTNHGDTQSKLAREYLDCIGEINDRTATENFTNKNTRRDVVLESCREISNSYTVVQEQVYYNACLSAGKNNIDCDDESVSKARQDTALLIRKATLHIDRTTAASM